MGFGISWENHELVPPHMGRDIVTEPLSRVMGRGVYHGHGTVPCQGLLCPAEEEDKAALKPMKLFWSMRCLLAAQLGSGPAASSLTKGRMERALCSPINTGWGTRELTAVLLQRISG